VSFRYPGSWTGSWGERDGRRYQYLHSPVSGAKQQADAWAQASAFPAPASLDDYARSQMEGAKTLATQDESRPPAHGRSYLYEKPDRELRALLLLQDGERLYVLEAGARAGEPDAYRRALEEMTRSFTLERPAAYPVLSDKRFGFAIGLPASWRETQRFSGRGRLLLQFLSPALAADRQRDTVHSSLALTVEPLDRDEDSLEAYYAATRKRLGVAYTLLSHAPWGSDGYVDVMHVETPMSASRVKRFYRVAGGRGYCLAFEAREDVYSKVARWCDLIAGTFKVEETRAS
jgi:hypothetical protein